MAYASLVSSSGPDYFIEWVAASGSGVVLDGNENTVEFGYYKNDRPHGKHITY